MSNRAARTHSSPPPEIADRGLPASLDDPFLAVQALLLRDFLHDIGQSASLLSMVIFNLNMTRQLGQDAAFATAAAPRLERMSVGVDDLVDLLGAFRSLGRTAVATHGESNSWQAFARRVERVTRLQRERTNTLLNMIGNADQLHASARLGHTELVLVCLIKENLVRWPAQATGPLTVRLLSGNEGGNELALSCSGPASEAPVFVITELAQWIARRLNVTLSSDDQGVRIHAADSA